MKLKSLSFVTCLLASVPGVAQASSGDDPFRDRGVEGEESTGDGTVSSGAVVANPVGLLFGLVSGDVGVGVADNLSVNLGGSYWNFELLGVETTAWGVNAGAQYFFTGTRFGGAFVYPTLEYASTTVSFDGAHATGSLGGPAAVVGYQWDWKPFTLRVAGGGRYHVRMVSNGIYSSDLEGFGLKADGSLGVTWL